MTLISIHHQAKQNLEDLYRICHTLDPATGESSIIVQLSYNEVKFDKHRRSRYISQFSNLLTYGKEKKNCKKYYIVRNVNLA